MGAATISQAAGSPADAAQSSLPSTAVGQAAASSSTLPPTQRPQASKCRLPATSSSSDDTLEEERPADSFSTPKQPPSLPQNKEGSVDDRLWVEFAQEDAENPFNFSRARKWTITLLSVFFTAEVAATASAYVPGIDGMEQDLHVKNHLLSLFGISIYALGFGIPPLVLAPFSEVFGRRNVYLVSALFYTLFFLCVGFAQNMTTVLIGRFLGGAFGSTGSTLVGGTIADIWESKDRGLPMALFALGALGGTGLGPVWAGWVAQRQDLGWRWIQWIQAIFTAVAFIVLLIFLTETRGSVVLTRRAVKLRKETGDQRYRARAEEERASIAALIKTSLTRPLWLLVSEPIVFFFSLWISFQWGIMYGLLESIGLISDLHNYTLGQSGLVFLSIVLASIVGFLSNFIQERLYAKNVDRKGPEARLYLAMVSAVLFPAGCFIYAWTSYPDVSIAGPIVGVVILMTGVYHV